ncbi:MAG: hypothetical protein ACD_63C00005G0001 [uncultured bacterium]|nr:MAG: hypothetical protein ACD_63C00005G0001 [uncultured bacterium]
MGSKKYIRIKNIGDGRADYVKLKLYMKIKEKVFSRDPRSERDWEDYKSDREGYDILLLSMGGAYPLETIPILLPQDVADIEFYYAKPVNKEQIVDALLVIFYGEPNPIEIPFKFELKP